MFLCAWLAMSAIPPLTPEIPAVARPTFYPGQVLDLSADGTTAAGSFHLGAYQQYLRLWDIETGAVVNDLWLGTADTVTSAKFSPDGNQLYTGGASHAVQIWDTATRELRATLYTVPAAKPGDAPADWVIVAVGGHFVGTPTGEQVLRFRDATVATWPGLRPSAGTVPAAALPQLRHPEKVKGALAGK